MDHAIATAPPQEAGRITDEALALLRAKIGQVMKTSHTPYLTETSRDGVRHWVDGIGDRNRLFVDDGYAKASVWRTTLSPPTILYAFDKLAIGYRGGLPGVHSMFGGTDWNWLRPIAWGERLHTVVTFIDLIERPSKFAGRSFQQISEITFENDAGEAVAVSRAWGFRTERKTAAEKGKYRSVAISTYTPKEIEAIAERYRNEYIRGAETLFIEDVKVGDELPEIIRGPYTVTTAVAFEQGWGGLFIKAHGQSMDYFARHPKAGLINDFGVPEPPEAVHWDSDLARKVGVSAAYDYGPERIAWVGSLLTNWAGDAGFLERLHVEVRRHNIIGDLTTCKAKVIALPEGPEGRVELEVLAMNQHGEMTAKGSARVRLPSRVRQETRAKTPRETGSTPSFS